MANLHSKFDSVVTAVKSIRPGETFRHYISPADARNKGNSIASKLGTMLRNRGVACKVNRYEHIIVVTRLEA